MFHSQAEHSGMTSESLTSGASISIHSPPQFLPEYLLGDPTSVATSPIHSHRLWSSNPGDSYSPTKSSHVSFGTPNGVGSHASSGAIPIGQVVPGSPSAKFGRSIIGEKHGGPPIQGLFDQNQVSSPLSSSFSMTPAKPVARLSTTFGPGTPGASTRDSSAANLSSSIMSPAQLDPFYTQGEALKADEELDETWVTVFGFPSSAVSYILQQFSQYGNILEHKISGCSNWVHIHYQSKIQAKKALGKNGKIFSGNMMIGVQPCIDKYVMNESMKENLSMMSPLQFTPTHEGSFSDKSASNKLSGIRPLTNAYRTAASSHEVAPSSRTPQKKNSVVTKAMEYVFGW